LYVIRFLREVVSHSAENQMDAHNLAVVFAPTIFRPELQDVMKAAMEVKLTQVLLNEIIVRERMLALSLLQWRAGQERLLAAQLAESGERIGEMAKEAVARDISGNGLLSACFDDLADRHWTCFGDLYPDLDERPSAVTAATTTSSLDHHKETGKNDVEEEAETPTTQSEDELQSMIAAHMHSAMRGRVNLSTGRAARHAIQYKYDDNDDDIHNENNDEIENAKDRHHYNDNDNTYDVSGPRSDVADMLPPPKPARTVKALPPLPASR
jgi:hypothetical protein